MNSLFVTHITPTSRHPVICSTLGNTRLSISVVQEALHSLPAAEDTAGLAVVFHSHPAADRSHLAVVVRIDPEAAGCTHPEAGHSLAEEEHHTRLGHHIRFVVVVVLLIAHPCCRKMNRWHPAGV